MVGAHLKNVFHQMTGYTGHRLVGWDAIWLLLSPQTCRQCGNLVEHYRDGVICRSCWEHWRTEQAQRPMICERCGRWADLAVTDGVVRRECEQCMLWVLTWARSGGVYTGALRGALLALKRAPWLALPLRQLLRQTWQQQSQLHTTDLIVPIPLARERQAYRGYNQAALLAREIAHTARRPLVVDALERVRETTPHRAGLDEQARRAGLKGAFRVTRPRLVANRRVLLVDDVLTSGATLDLAAQALLAAGALEVSALTAARTLRRARQRVRC